MSRQRTRDTAPELALRRELHSLGLRFRVHRRPLPGVRATPDVVFGPARLAVRVHGCFWHSCPRHRTQPAANAEWWAAKLDRNRARDREIAAAYSDAGWLLITVWEHEDSAEAAVRIADIVRSRRAKS